MQSETISAAYRLWRRNWKGRGREYTAGALVWQLNDCWPVTSWAIVRTPYLAANRRIILKYLPDRLLSASQTRLFHHGQGASTLYGWHHQEGEHHF